MRAGSCNRVVSGLPTKHKGQAPFQKPAPDKLLPSLSQVRYSIPFVESTLPTNRSSGIVAWSSALASALKIASMM